MPSEQPPTGKKPRHSHRLIVFLLLAGCVVVGALLVHQHLAAPRGPAQRTLRSADAGPGPASEPAFYGDLAALAANPLAVADLEELKQDPPDALAPPEGVRLSGLRRKLPYATSDIIRYLSSSSSDAVAAFYRTSLAQRGFKLVKDGKNLAGDGPSLTFVQDRRVFQVELHPAEKGTKVRVVLVITRSTEQ
jgi:hypothetical protein